MSELKRVVRSGVANVSRLNAKRKLKELSQAGPKGARLARVLEKSLDHDLSERTKNDWFAKIEALRTDLERDDTTVLIKDFGFGSSDAERTESEMQEGVMVEKTISQQCSANKPAFWAALLHDLVFEYQPDVAIELGTCLGVSAAYQSSAMERSGAGTFVTMEGAESLAKKSAENLETLGLGDRVRVVEGKFSDTLGGVLEEHSSVGYAFIDGHHEETATLEYFEQILPHATDDCLMVFDDINWTEGMQRAWKRVTEHPDVAIGIDLGAVGVCVIERESNQKTVLNAPLRGL